MRHLAKPLRGTNFDKRYGYLHCMIVVLLKPSQIARLGGLKRHLCLLQFVNLILLLEAMLELVDVAHAVSLEGSVTQ